MIQRGQPELHSGQHDYIVTKHGKLLDETQLKIGGLGRSSAQSKMIGYIRFTGWRVLPAKNQKPQSSE